MAVEAVPPFIDTNVLLYLLSGDASKANRAEAVLTAGVVISVQVLNEFANVARRKFALEWLEVRQAIIDIRRFAVIETLTLETHERGLDLASRYGFSVYDAMVVAAALNGGCTRLLSEDLQHGQRLEGRLMVHNPFQ